MLLKAFGEGRLTKDPELQEFQNGDKTTALTRFSIAVNEYHKSKGDDKKVVHFFDCEAWDSGAKIIAQYARKGDTICFSAIVKQNRWNDKNSGDARSKVVFRIEEFRIFEKRANGGARPQNDSPDDSPSDDGGVPDGGSDDQSAPF